MMNFISFKQCPLSSVIAGNSLATLCIGVFGFALPMLSTSNGVAGKWIGLSFSGYFLAKLCIAPIAGILSDRLGPGRLLIGVTLVGAILPLVHLASTHVLSVQALFVLLGFIAGAVKPVSLAVIGSESPDGKRGKYFGLYHVYSFVALIIGPLIGGMIVDPRNPRPILIFISVCLVLVLLLFIGGLRGASRYPILNLERTPSQSSGRSALAASLMLAIAGRTFGIAALNAFLPLWLLDRIPYNGPLFGFLAAVPNLAACVILPLGGRLADRMDRIRLAFSGMVVSASGLILLHSCDRISGMIAAGIIMGIGTGLSIPAAMASASESGRRTGERLGFYQGAANLGFMTGPLLCGLIMDVAGIPSLFALTGCVGLLTCLPLVFFVSVAPRIFHKKRMIRFAGAACLAGVLIAFGATILTKPRGVGANESFHFADTALGTVARLTLIAEKPKTADSAARKAFDLIHQLSRDFDHRRPEGSVGRINAASGEHPVTLSEDAFRLVHRALGYCILSGGVFDIAIGAVTTHPDFLTAPSEEKSRSLVDYRMIRIDRSARAVFLPVKGMAIDLGGLAKGTIIDRTVDLLKRSGISAGIVEIGGDFYCFGRRSWRTGIQHPRMDAMIGVIAAEEQAICGSGDYYQFVLSGEEDSIRRHHIIDPNRMESAASSIGVTVIAASTEQADALATTLFIMGPDRGMAFLNAHYPDVSALWVTPDMNVVATVNFPPFISE